MPGLGQGAGGPQLWGREQCPECSEYSRRCSEPSPPRPAHPGFYNAWRLGGFSERVLSRLEEVVGGLQVDPSQLSFFVTGEWLAEQAGGPMGGQ